jgi:hypothetical protein
MKVRSTVFELLIEDRWTDGRLRSNMRSAEIQARLREGREALANYECSNLRLNLKATGFGKVIF